MLFNSSKTKKYILAASIAATVAASSMTLAAPFGTIYVKVAPNGTAPLNAAFTNSMTIVPGTTYAYEVTFLLATATSQTNSNITATSGKNTLNNWPASNTGGVTGVNMALAATGSNLSGFTFLDQPAQVNGAAGTGTTLNPGVFDDATFANGGTNNTTTITGINAAAASLQFKGVPTANTPAETVLVYGTFTVPSSGLVTGSTILGLSMSGVSTFTTIKYRYTATLTTSASLSAASETGADPIFTTYISGANAVTGNGQAANQIYGASLNYTAVASGNNSQILIASPTTSDGSTGASAKTVNLGNFLAGANVTSASLSINHTGTDAASYTVAIGGDTASTTFANGSLATGNTSASGTITLNNSFSATPKSGTVTIDNTTTDSNGAGLGSADANDVFTVTANVGYAHATNVDMNTFGATLGAHVLGNGTYNLSSTSDATGNTATIAKGTNTGAAEDITMAWRRPVAEELTPQPTNHPIRGANILRSDVVEILGMNGATNESPAHTQTDPFALVMSYTPYVGEGGDASAGFLRLAWLDRSQDGNAGNATTGDLWRYATEGNFGQGTVLQHQEMTWAAFASANGITDGNVGDFLGSWGVDVGSHTVWAVLNHNSDFAVLPEPASLGLLALGAMGLLVRRRKA